jgi:hypothetical protein
MKKALAIIIPLVVIIAGGLVYWFVLRNKLADQIVIPYIAHQKPRIDPHVPSHVPVADKLDEAVFDGLFNISANPSGIVYEDGLGELIDRDENNVVTIRINPRASWHESYAVAMEKDKISITPAQSAAFAARDLQFTLRRIQTLGSLSPDYVLVNQALEDFDFSGPDENQYIRFQFRDDRIWTEDDIKEVLSFKILPASAEINAAQYTNGTGPYLYAGQHEDRIHFFRNPDGAARMTRLTLRPFIDNSTYTTELKNGNINVLLGAPFGSVSPLLSDTSDFFTKSNISTTCFALLFNVRRLDREQRRELRKVFDNVSIVEQFFKINTEQQRHIVDYKGGVDNYEEYLNYSIFPATSYYVQEDVVTPLKPVGQPDMALLPDTVRIQTCLNFGFREELAELVEIFNMLYPTTVAAEAVPNDQIAQGAYDAVLVPITGYRSNFLFDMYDIFLREPDFSTHRISLQTIVDNNGEMTADPRSFQARKNFFGIDLTEPSAEQDDFARLLDYIYNFMSTRHIGDKHAYAQFIDQLDQDLALGRWLFSLPSLNYFSTQFDEQSINLYGVASQLSTIEQWREQQK